MKGAIVQLARNCAHDFAKYTIPTRSVLYAMIICDILNRYNIRSNSICAGTIETPISAVERSEHGWTFEQWEALKVKDVIMGRVGHVREIANATLFFACDESSYCTGTHLMVDGGQTFNTVGGRLKE